MTGLNSTGASTSVFLKAKGIILLTKGNGAENQERVLNFLCENGSTQLAVHPDTPNAKKPFHVKSTPLTKNKKIEEFLHSFKTFHLITVNKCCIQSHQPN